MPLAMFGLNIPLAGPFGRVPWATLFECDDRRSGDLLSSNQNQHTSSRPSVQVIFPKISPQRSVTELQDTVCHPHTCNCIHNTPHHHTTAGNRHNTQSQGTCFQATPAARGNKPARNTSTHQKSQPNGTSAPQRLVRLLAGRAKIGPPRVLSRLPQNEAMPPENRASRFSMTTRLHLTHLIHTPHNATPSQPPTPHSTPTPMQTLAQRTAPHRFNTGNTHGTHHNIVGTQARFTHDTTSTCIYHRNPSFFLRFFCVWSSKQDPLVTQIQTLGHPIPLAEIQLHTQHHRERYNAHPHTTTPSSQPVRHNNQKRNTPTYPKRSTRSFYTRPTPTRSSLASL